MDAARLNQLLTPMTTINTGTWNVRTMFEAELIRHSSGIPKERETVEAKKKTTGEDQPNNSLCHSRCDTGYQTRTAVNMSTMDPNWMSYASHRSQSYIYIYTYMNNISKLTAHII